MNDKDVLVLITGSNRGLGYELHEKFSEKYSVIGINRSSDRHNDIIIDLSSQSIDLEAISRRIANAEQIIFISNASTISPIKKIANISPMDIDTSMFVNFINPAKIINLITSSNSRFSIINITSGAAFTKNESLSLYSSSKAAMHRFIEILEKENETNNKCLMVMNFDPGRMQTEMQSALMKEKKMDPDLMSTFNEPKKVAIEIFDFIEKKLC